MRLLHSIGGNGRTRVLMSVIRLHSTYGRCTVRAVAADRGISPATAYWHLRRLRDERLVDWEDYAQGTLRPLVDVVA